MERMDPRKQFSKWLARYGAIIWAIYAFAVLALIAYRPETAMACVWLTLIMTGNKILDTVAYTRNSVTEKMLLAILDKTKMELSLGTPEVLESTEENTEDEDEPEDGGDGVG